VFLYFCFIFISSSSWTLREWANSERMRDKTWQKVKVFLD
jgi:hypothetical protein